MQQIPPVRRRIRLFPDYGRDFPLWENSTPTWDVGCATTPQDYGLSPRLATALADWQAFWESHFDLFTGWDTKGNRKQWKHGYRLARDLRAQVHAFADVQAGF